jgi:hypothetical protein
MHVNIRYLEPRYRRVDTSAKYEKEKVEEILNIEITNDTKSTKSTDGNLLICITLIDGKKKSSSNLLIPKLDKLQLRNIGSQVRFMCSDECLSWFNWIHNYVSIINAQMGVGLNMRTLYIISMIGANMMAREDCSPFPQIPNLEQNVDVIICGKYINIATETADLYLTCELPKLYDLKKGESRWDPFALRFRKETYSF